MIDRPDGLADGQNWIYTAPRESGSVPIVAGVVQW